MTHVDEMVLETFLEETTERLDAIESGLLKLEHSSADQIPSLVHDIFRQAHSVKAGANLLKFVNIEALSHKLENILEMMRKGLIKPNDMTITALLEAVDKLRELTDNISVSDTISIRLHSAMLDMVVRKQTQA